MGSMNATHNIKGHTCIEPAPSFFFVPLNFYLYEAEEAMPI